MADSVAIIGGGGDCVWSELDAAKALCAEAGVKWLAFVVNDMIAQYPDECHAVTLHPEKLPGWLKTREGSGYPSPIEVWGHRLVKDKGMTKASQDWRGSSGLLATKIAIVELKFRKVLLCGVPMTTGNHFARLRPWHAASVFKQAWITQKTRLAPLVRSFSGWTAEQLGKPTLDFLLAP